MDNANTKEYLDKIRSQVIENLKRTAFAPSVQMTDVPREPLVEGMDDEADAILDDLDEDENKDKRYTKRRFDQYIEKSGELSDSEDEEELAANGVRRQHVAKRRNHANYRHLDVADSGVESGIATPREASSVPDEDMDTTADGHADKVEAPATTVEQQPAPSEAKPAPTKPVEEPATESKEAVPEGTGQAASSPMTSVLTDANSDVDMEDAGAAPQEPEQPPAAAGAAVAAAVQEKTPPASPPQEPAATEQSAPAERSASPATEAPQPAEGPAEATGEPSIEKPKETEAAAVAAAAETEVKTEEQSEKEKEKEEASEPKEPAKPEES